MRYAILSGGHASGPKDGDPRAGHVSLHAPGPGGGRESGSAPAGWGVEHVRVTYDVERADRAIEESDLPDAFADHLRTGRA